MLAQLDEYASVALERPQRALRTAQMARLQLVLVVRVGVALERVAVTVTISAMLIIHTNGIRRQERIKRTL
jgi:hypothetical protein